jgi:hypothetical protein
MLAKTLRNSSVASCKWVNPHLAFRPAAARLWPEEFAGFGSISRPLADLLIQVLQVPVGTGTELKPNLSILTTSFFEHQPFTIRFDFDFFDI